MLYDELKQFREYLQTIYSHETAKTYTIRLDGLLQGQSVSNTINQFNVPLVIKRLEQLKYKNEFSQGQNAFLRFCEYYNISLSDEQLTEIQTLKESTKKKYRKLKPVLFNEIDSKIKRIRNWKMKTSFQVMLAVGLRVSELSSIKKENCAIETNKITLRFIGKGGKAEQAIMERVENPLLFDRTKRLIEGTKPQAKVFYSTIYLQTKAKELGFQCIDLRRSCAKIEYKKSHSKEKVRQKLRHSSVKNTDIYLKSKVDIHKKR